MPNLSICLLGVGISAFTELATFFIQYYYCKLPLTADRSTTELLGILCL